MVGTIVGMCLYACLTVSICLSERMGGSMAGGCSVTTTWSSLHPRTYPAKHYIFKKKLTYVLPIYGTREGVCAQTCLQAIRYMFNNCNRRYENVAHLSYTRIAQDWRSPILRGRCSVKCTQRGPVQARERNNINPREMLGRWRHSRGVKRCPQVKTTTKQSAVMNTPDSKQRVCASCNGRHTLRYWVRIEENSWGSIYGQF